MRLQRRCEARYGSALRTYLGGRRGGLVYVERDSDDSVCASACAT
jgi:hypothetical protein